MLYEIMDVCGLNGAIAVVPGPLGRALGRLRMHLKRSAPSLAVVDWQCIFICLSNRSYLANVDIVCFFSLQTYQ